MKPVWIRPYRLSFSKIVVFCPFCKTFIINIFRVYACFAEPLRLFCNSYTLLRPLPYNVFVIVRRPSAVQLTAAIQ